jgi:tetrahydromethanopterin S-methyltransferase subunit F
MHLSEVIIHLDDMPDKSGQDDLVEPLRYLEGVIAPGGSQEKEYMLFVSYNPDTVDSTALVEKVRANGYKAQLVGM